MNAMIRPLLTLALLAFTATGARAEVRNSAPDSFFLAWSVPVSATPEKAWAALTSIGSWWSDEHTWSGHASNLSLQAQAGGCFCERWDGGSAEHGRVLMALPGKLLRLQAALGPLQEYALNGVLGFWLRYNDDGSLRIEVEYRVNGAATSGLDQSALQVDRMLGQQVERLVRYMDTGKADAPAEIADVAASTEVAREALLQQWRREAEAASGVAAPAPDAKGKAKVAKPKPAPKP